MLSGAWPLLINSMNSSCEALRTPSPLASPIRSAALAPGGSARYSLMISDTACGVACGSRSNGLEASEAEDDKEQTGEQRNEQSSTRLDKQTTSEKILFSMIGA